MSLVTLREVLAFAQERKSAIPAFTVDTLEVAEEIAAAAEDANYPAILMIGQNTFVALGKARYAVFFSLLRKVILVIPLMLLLPHLWGLGAYGVFASEPVSNVLGGVACYATMLAVVWKELRQPDRPMPSLTHS